MIQSHEGKLLHTFFPDSVFVFFVFCNHTPIWLYRSTCTRLDCLQFNYDAYSRAHTPSALQRPSHARCRPHDNSWPLHRCDSRLHAEHVPPSSCCHLHNCTLYHNNLRYFKYLHFMHKLFLVWSCTYLPVMVFFSVLYIFDI